MSFHKPRHSKAAHREACTTYQRQHQKQRREIARNVDEIHARI
jgi:hypothetical protein